ncbi:efflux RND transporter permease subunit [Parashewanella spongiae]|uniref:Efflux RND transporter permease subunit n=1 Tax=Parashewanella spongiae TaxID=342950 RepID=A0A3A6U8S4_9GAMM|nr:efflux RND transporter permease subunit [Parashewanella spongiae]RJY13205.1 efflux RND transporter permease subunit [Parashewanella spongiae]
MSDSKFTSRITDIFVNRPILAVILSLTLVIIGSISAMKLPVLQYPQIESSSLIIDTVYVGASAEEIQGFVTDPIEKAAATISGVDYISSESTSGASKVTVQLELNADSTKALAEINTRLSQIRFELPSQSQDPSVTVTRADRPFASFYLYADTKEFSRAELSDYLVRQVNPLLNALPDVQRVGLEGGRSPAMRIWLNPTKMAELNVSSNDIQQALARNNVAATIGRTRNPAQRIDLVANTLLKDKASFEQITIKEVGDRSIKLSDISRVELGSEQAAAEAGYNLTNSVYVSIFTQPGANEIAIGDKLYERLETINKALPKDLKLKVAYDATKYMRESIKEVFTTLIETIVLVGIVILVMMGSFRTALVPLITIPISILGAIAAMTMMGFSLNLLTLLAIVLSVGLVVDDAIVVVENVARHMRNGMSGPKAALLSSRQLFTPIIGMTITLAAVYAPIGFLSGLTGVLFKEFVFTLATAVLMSGLVALTLSPIMSAKVSPEGGKEGKITRKINAQFTRLETAYRALLQRVFQSRPQVIVLAIFITSLIIPFYLFSKSELAPVEDQSSVQMFIETPPESTLEYTSEQMKTIVASAIQTPNSVGMWHLVFGTSGFGGLNFVPVDERQQNIQQLQGQLFGLLSQFPQVTAFPILPAALPTSGQFDVEMVVTSSVPQPEMAGYAQQLVYAAFQSGNFLFADTDLKVDLPQIGFQFDKAKIADLDMTISDVNEQLSFLLSDNYVNRFNLDGKAYKVIPQVEERFRNDQQGILQLQLTTPSGDLIPLSSIATVSSKAAPRKLTKFGQRNSFRIYGGINGGSTKEQALASLEKAAAQILPASYSIDYVGESRQIRSEGNTLVGVLGVALVFVFFVLAIQFNSFRDPLVVLLGSVPLALSGALLLSFTNFTTINIYSQIGLITLVGLVAKNGILIVEFARHLQMEGKSRSDAVIEAAGARLRPVLMTTAATVLGHFPLVLVTGAGAAARNSIGLILVAGMLIGTFFTLFVLPVIYSYIAQEHKSEVHE